MTDTHHQDDVAEGEGSTNGHVKAASQARNEANRRNAGRSTGPRTAEGRRRSSQNAVRHGVYSRGDEAIARGELREDPEAVAAMVNGLMTPLTPRDELEHHHAHQIAMLQLRLQRLDAYETYLLQAAGRFTGTERRQMGDDELVNLKIDVIEALQEYLDPDHESVVDVDFELLVAFVRQTFVSTENKLAKVLLRDPQPGDSAGWARLLDDLVEQLGFETVAERLRSIRMTLMRSHIENYGRQIERAARNATEHLKATVALRSSVSSQLQRALLLYTMLKSRPVAELEAEALVEPE